MDPGVQKRRPSRDPNRLRSSALCSLHCAACAAMMAVTGRFDALAVEHGVHALDTIGDAYLAATNLNGDQVDSPPNFSTMISAAQYWHQCK
jgi:hypothetical protein